MIVFLAGRCSQDWNKYSIAYSCDNDDPCCPPYTVLWYSPTLLSGFCPSVPIITNLGLLLIALEINTTPGLQMAVPKCRQCHHHLHVDGNLPDVASTSLDVALAVLAVQQTTTSDSLRAHSSPQVSHFPLQVAHCHGCRILSDSMMINPKSIVQLMVFWTR